MTDSTTDVEDVLVALGLASPGTGVASRPLTGGVSSDISVVTTDRGTYCVKRALPKLKVDADWYAPVERSTYEARWLQAVETLAPGGAPRLLGHDPDSGYLVMEFLPDTDHQVWKSQLLDARTSPAFAERVGDLIGRIHQGASRRADALRDEFDSTQLFVDLRVEPYFHATARQHPDLEPVISARAEALLQHRTTLVHGDVSPKNILEGPDGAPKLLDAECAWWGDPAFDLSFCCNHLLLKQLHLPHEADRLDEAVRCLVRGYAEHVDWEPVDALTSRTAQLLPVLALARIDGKSPVEYLRETTRQQCRRLARLLVGTDLDLTSTLDTWKAQARG